MRRAAAVVALVVVTLVLAQGAAGAQTEPGGFGDPNRCANAAEGDSGLGGGGNAGGGAGGGGGGSWGGGADSDVVPTTVAAKPGDRDEAEGEEGVCSSLIDSQAPGPAPGQFETSKYDIGYDDGGTCVCYDRRLTGWLTNASFWIGKSLIRVGLGIINWGLEFKLADSFLPVAERISTGYQTKVVDRIGIIPLFLTYTAVWASFLVVRGQMSRGLGEVATSLVLYAITATLLANPGALLTQGLETVAGVSWEVAAVATGDGAATPDTSRQVGGSMMASIHRAFVEDPHEIINWSRSIPAGDPCRATYEAAVASGPWGTSSKPRVAMKNAGCRVEDAFNRDPSLDRLGAAVFDSAAGALVVALVLMITVSLMSFQLGILGVIALAPLAAPFASLPGRGRALFWRLVGFGAVCFMGVIVMAMLLSLTLVGVSGALQATSGMPLFLQMMSVTVVVGMALKKRKSIFDSGRAAVNGFSQAMVGTQSSSKGKTWINPGLSHTQTLAPVAAAYGGYRMYTGHQAQKRGDERLNMDRERLGMDRERLDMDRSRLDAPAGGDYRTQNLVLILSGRGATGRDSYDSTAWEQPRASQPAELASA